MFFSERVINVWNSLPCDITNFSSVKAFKRSVGAIDLSLASALALFSMCLYLVYLIYLCFFVNFSVFYTLGQC